MGAAPAGRKPQPALRAAGGRAQSL